jgi:hypothetical protein
MHCPPAVRYSTPARCGPGDNRSRFLREFFPGDCLVQLCGLPAVHGVLPEWVLTCVFRFGRCLRVGRSERRRRCCTISEWATTRARAASPPGAQGERPPARLLPPRGLPRTRGSDEPEDWFPPSRGRHDFGQSKWCLPTPHILPDYGEALTVRLCVVGDRARAPGPQCIRDGTIAACLGSRSIQYFLWLSKQYSVAEAVTQSAKSLFVRAVGLPTE